MSLQSDITALAHLASATVATGERWDRIVTAVLDAFCEVGGNDAVRAVQRATGNYRQRRNKMPLSEHGSSP